MNIEERNFQEKLKLGNNALFWIKLANKCHFDLKKQLLGLATILLPLTASIVVVPIDTIDIVGQDKNLIISGWLFLALSIILGLVQTKKDIDYFVRQSRDSNLREHLRNVLPGNSAEKAVSALPSVPPQSTHAPLYFQAIALLVGLLLIMSVATKLLLYK